MALYFVGDIQGCLSELKALLEQVNFDIEQDELWLVGDLVARGPDSLATLRFIKSLKDRAKPVLGNHDLHLLAIHEGLKKAKKSDHLGAILAAPDRNELMDWLAQQPLLRQIPGENAFMSHAGIAPQWTIAQAIEQAAAAQQKLSSPQRHKWLRKMYGEKPDNWLKATTAVKQFRFTINAFTRMRFCFKDLSLEFDTKSDPQHAPKKLKPWYLCSAVLNDNQWVFGHWAALMGECQHPNVFALDTGCVWGNHLTLLRWHDKKIFAEPAHKNKRTD